MGLGVLTLLLQELYERSTQIEPPANASVGPSAKFKQFFQR